MLLILSNSVDATCDYLVGRLLHQGVAFLRLNTDTLTSEVVVEYAQCRPALRCKGAWYAPNQFSHVWYRRPERLRDPRFNDSPEANFILEEWAEAVEGFLSHIEEHRWINHPARNVRASHKLEQLSRATACALKVPETLLTQDESRLREFYSLHSGRIIAKPMATGYIERSKPDADSLIYTNRVRPGDLNSLESLCDCPTLFQQFVDKSCDVRITVLDEDLHAVELKASEPDGTQRCDIRRNDMEDVSYRRIDLPADIRHHLRQLIDAYGLRFAAIDMAITRAGEWIFFEINPNGQWAWLDLAGVTDIASSFIRRFAGSAG
jgi:glutathione synthase/RimK-type ligase-like ATP-grasp enzyme